MGLRRLLATAGAALALVTLAGTSAAAVINLKYTIDPYSDLSFTHWRPGPAFGSWAVGDTINVEFDFGDYYLTLWDKDDNSIEKIGPWVGAYADTIDGGIGVGATMISSPSGSYRDKHGDVISLTFASINPWGCCANFGGMLWTDFIAAGDKIDVVAFLFTYTIASAEYSPGGFYGNYFSMEGIDKMDIHKEIPEPGTLALLGLGLASLATARRRRQ